LHEGVDFCAGMEVRYSKTPKTENYTQFRNMTDPQGHIPCASFTKF